MYPTLASGDASHLSGFNGMLFRFSNLETRIVCFVRDIRPSDLNTLVTRCLIGISSRLALIYTSRHSVL